MKVKTKNFIEAVISSNGKHKDIQKIIEEATGEKLSLPAISIRIGNLRRNGKLPLASGNQVSTGEILKGTSTLYDKDGNVSIQWVKTNVEAQQQIDAVAEAIKELVKTVKPLSPVPHDVEKELNDENMTVYISNDIHFGAYMWADESGTEWDLEIASNTVRAAYDHLFATSPDSRVGLIADLGDLLEADDYKNQTPKSGNVLAVDGRYPKILRCAYESLIYAIQKALLKHEVVHFINIAGNHDITTGAAIREIIRAFFRDEPRVVIDESPAAIKYHQHGTTLIQFAHGDGLKMRDAGETMAADCQDIFSATEHRFGHFGHTHKDAVLDGRLCRSESHRNLAPLNDWAAHKGYRRQLGTMKSITYSDTKGEISRSLYNITAEDGEKKG